MISENCDIDEFVERVKHMDILDVVALAVDETTAAERIFFGPTGIPTRTGCVASSMPAN
ncbi:hypothetical protein [Desulfosarcina cetonica]|uniref:hypothetical protein n=1 Tax=Desulfosarcina cetonica TaxID=90730 RepID=UPI0012ECEAB4|nr:hypothetical protein [Desulfosarcina cetonica]